MLSFTDMQHQDLFQEKALLILDLDETLIHSCLSDRGRPSDLNIYDYFVYKRPYLNTFLQEMFKYYKIAVWSTGSDDYVNLIVNAIKPEDCNFKFIWGRTHCKYCNAETILKTTANIAGIDYVKPLKKVKRKGYSLERMLIVDDSPYKLADNYGNAIYIKPYMGELDDLELLKLTQYLKSIADISDFRKLEKRGWDTT
jgi:carboxy-terminal domain RNA polymerase II polypeptide A small phosphatase